MPSDVGSEAHQGHFVVRDDVRATWKAGSAPPSPRADKSMIERSSVEQPEQEVARSHRHRCNVRFRILLAAAQAQFESVLAVSVESERWVASIDN